MDAEQLNRDVDSGELSSRQLVDIILQQQQMIDELRKELKQARDRIARLQEEAGQKNATQRLDEEYSLEAEEKRSRRKRKRKQKSERRGRRTTAEKLAQAERSEIVLPQGFSQEECTLRRSRPVWRIENDRAVLVAYHIYRGPDGQLPPLPGLLSRCEFGLEILVAVAFLVFNVRLSMDKVCAQLAFFWELILSKSQADALLSRLIRKAIKLTLLHPENAEYRRFLDGLLALFRRANRIARDGRLKEETRRKKVGALEEDLRTLCESRYHDASEPSSDAEADYLRLANELMRLREAEELFTFVIHAEVAGTNNEAERGLRDSAQDRNIGRTSKTIRGARRRTIATSVLESLRLYLPEFTLRNVLDEVNGWLSSGRSRFHHMLETLGLSLPPISPLEAVLPLPDR
jgi:hypothetical protein